MAGLFSFNWTVDLGQIFIILGVVGGGLAFAGRFISQGNLLVSDMADLKVDVKNQGEELKKITNILVDQADMKARITSLERHQAGI